MSSTPGCRISAAESIGRASGLEPGPPEPADATRGLFERHSRQIFAFCFSRLGSREEAEDAVQSTFLNAHRALQRGVMPDSELAWLLKIAHNVCLTRRRSTRRRGRVEAAHDLESMQDYLPAPEREPADELIRLTDALEDLPASQRRAILLREWQGLSYAEIARELKVTQSAVETLIFRARRSLAANLEAVVVKPRLLARARHALDLGWLVAGLRALLEGSVAAKAATAAVAVSTAAVVATSPADVPQRSLRVAPPPAAAAVSSPPAPAAPGKRPRLQERFEATTAPRAAAQASTNVTASVPFAKEPAAAKERKAKHESRAAVAREKKAKPKRTVQTKRTKAKHTAKPTRQVVHAKLKPKVKAKPKKTAPAPAPKPEESRAAGPPEKAKAAEPEPANGKTK